MRSARPCQHVKQHFIVDPLQVTMHRFVVGSSVRMPGVRRPRPTSITFVTPVSARPSSSLLSSSSSHCRVRCRSRTYGGCAFFSNRIVNYDAGRRALRGTTVFGRRHYCFSTTTPSWMKAASDTNSASKTTDEECKHSSNISNSSSNCNDDGDDGIYDVTATMAYTT